MTSARIENSHPPVKHGKVGVLLVNLGTPDGTDYASMRRYLKEFLTDKRVIEWPRIAWYPILFGIVLNTRPGKVGKAYETIWNKDRNESYLRTYTRSQAELMAEALKDHPQLSQLLREQLEQVQQRLNRELNRARLAGDSLPGALFDCEQELPGLLATLRMIHGEHLDLSYQVAPGLQLPWDREDLLELLGNLLDNACKWADAEVRLSVSETPQGYRLAVEDDGPGIPEAQRDQVFSRGARLDEQRVGHGLGLGIVRDIVEVWGGVLQLQESELGGLKVLIELPRR